MDEVAVRAALQHYLDYSTTDDDIAHEIYHDDAVLAFPQSGGAVRGSPRGPQVGAGDTAARSAGANSPTNPTPRVWPGGFPPSCRGSSSRWLSRPSDTATESTPCPSSSSASRLTLSSVGADRRGHEDTIRNIVTDA